MLKRIFSSIFGNPQVADEELSVRFGRYSDAHKSPEKHDAWDRAIMHFEQENYLQSYIEFFHYLLDDEEENVSFSFEEKGKEDFSLRFSIYQGSKQIQGYANRQEFVGQVRVAISPNPNLALHRKLMEMNYELIYSAFSLNDDAICMRFTTLTEDGFPGKLYNGLREIATRADQQDDLLLEEFRDLKSADDPHVIALAPSEVAIKKHYFHQWLEQAFEQAKPLWAENADGAVSYVLLNALYKIDYLLTPEGTILSQIEQAHQNFFSKDGSTVNEKNKQVEKILKNLYNASDEELNNNFYATKSTFGIAKPAYQQKIAQFLNSQLKAIQWYQNSAQQHLIPVILEYIAGYSLFNFGLPSPTRRLMHLYLRLSNDEFFRELGSKKDFVLNNKKLNKVLVQQHIQNIVKSEESYFSKFSFDTQKLAYKDDNLFGISYFALLALADYTTE
ncbi:MAG: hypothetical protein JJT94_10125 [Bernardetiaceae bacterium]|nr:hypothetical protein [Bernardetiaceae bacterium]